MSGRDYSVILGKDEATGEPKPVELDDGALKVATTGPDGAELATEATAERTADATEALAGTVGAGQPTAEDDAVAVAFKPGQEVITSPAATFADATAAQAAPNLGATYVAGDVSVTSPDLSAIRSNTDDLEANTDQVETKLDTGNASLAAIEADADVARIAGQSLDAKTLAPLGTDFATPVRGTATVIAAQLPSSSTPRGFTLENIDASADLWVGTDNTVTTANGFRISPSRARFFDLGNPSTLWVISASTTAWQIGAVS